MSKKIQLSILSVVLAAALLGSVVAYGDNMVFATKKTSNDASQAIEQGQWSSQGSQCVAGGSPGDESKNGHDSKSGQHKEKEPRHDKEFSGIFASCNNVDLQFQNNDGKLALGQQ
jgi:hypothetical protein